MGFLEDARARAAIEDAQRAASRVVEFENKLAKAEADMDLPDREKHIKRLRGDIETAKAELELHEANVPADTPESRAVEGLTATAAQAVAELQILAEAANLSDVKKVVAENVLERDPAAVLAVVEQMR